MKQFLLPPNFKGESKFELNPEDSHYFKDVLRMQIGESLDAIDAESRKWAVKIYGYRNNLCQIELKKIKTIEQNQGTKINLFQCFPKNKKIDIILKACAEAGVSEITFVKSDYSIPKIAPEDFDRKLSRWNKIIKQALQLSGSRIIPKITGMVKIKEIVKRENEIFLFFHQKELENKSLHRYLDSDLGAVNLLIGPEGGFSENEADWLFKNNFSPVYLGPNILRSEIAAIYAIAAVRTILLEKGKWTLKEQE